MALKVMYTIFLGILVSLFVGLGISAFYEAPKAPEYPKILESEPYAAPVSETKPLPAPSPESAEAKQQRETYQKASDQYYKEDFPRYNRNVSIISMIGAILILIAALAFVVKIELLSDGLLLGGVLTLLYSLIRGFMGEDNMYRFIVTTIGLGIALVIGYLKFIKHENES